MKINTICFILLFFFMISAVNAADNNNETLESINQIDTNVHVDKVHEDALQAKSDTNEVISKSVESENTFSAIKNKTTSSATEKTTLSSKAKVTMKAPDVKMYYKDGSKFKVTLKDSSKKVIKNKKIKITINGATYTKTTDKKGIATLSLTLKSGTYKVVSTFEGTSSYAKQSVKSTVTIKSTIKCSDFSKYYKNTAKYSSKFYDQKGKLLKNTAIKFKLNSKSYSVKTDKYGVGKLAIDLKPGKYSISSINSKTSETVTKTVTIKSIIETKDLTMKEKDGSKFSVKILNSYGKVSPNKKVTLKVNGKTYTPKTNKNGIATQVIDLSAGKYTITTEYNGLKNTNKIIVNKAATKTQEKEIKKTDFIHSIIIPSYVNVTVPYAFQSSAHTVKAGPNGTVKMPKVEVFTVEAASKVYTLGTGKNTVTSSIPMDEKSYLIPFSGATMTSSANRADLKDPGIIITKKSEYTQIDFQGITSDNIELFGVFCSKSDENSETFTYVLNNDIPARVTVQTESYNEGGVKYNLNKLYPDIDTYYGYNEVLKKVTDPVVFTNTGQPVVYNYFTRYIIGYPSKEDIMTKFTVNGVEELEKQETISYGLAENYRESVGFEVMQSYCIINEKITDQSVEKWLSKSSDYLNRFGRMNIYGMFMAGLETCWLADKIANDYSKDFNVTWNRDKTTTILGGINLETTYLHVLNADMGMNVTGNSKNVGLFKLANSINLPNIEEYALEPIANRYSVNTTNSLNNVFTSAKNNNFSIVQFNELLYVFNNNDSAIILNTTSGVCNVILNRNNIVYKGSQISTTSDCCGISRLPNDIIKGIQNSMKFIAPGIYLLSDHFKKIHPLSTMAYNVAKYVLSSTLTGTAALANGLLSTMVLIQTTGTTYRDKMIDEKDWHAVMDKVTFTRPGYLQSKKVYNIPNNKGGTDYIEVEINDDLSLDRTTAKYISEGKTKQLTKEETYQYFCEDYWTPFSMPTKYWDKSWKSGQ